MEILHLSVRISENADRPAFLTGRFIGFLAATGLLLTSTRDRLASRLGPVSATVARSRCRIACNEIRRGSPDHALSEVRNASSLSARCYCFIDQFIGTCSGYGLHDRRSELPGIHYFRAGIRGEMHQRPRPKHDEFLPKPRRYAAHVCPCRRSILRVARNRSRSGRV